MTIPTKLTEKYSPKSEFGRGFLVCLLKFAEHAEAYFRYKEMWFYGASDHLLELECPKELRGTRIEELIKRLHRYVRDYRLDVDMLREEDIIEIMDTVREIILLVDKEVFGLDADIGEY